MGLRLHRKRSNASKPPTSTDKADKVAEKDDTEPDAWQAAGLSGSQIELVKAQGDTTAENEKTANLFTVYRFASRKDLLLVAISSVCSIASGVPMPLMLVVFGQLVGNVSQQSAATSDSSQSSNLLGGSSRNNQVIYLVYLAIAELVLTFIATAGWQHTGRRISRKAREQYFRALLRQNVGFFDTFGTGKVTSHITSDMNQIQDGISEKVGITLRTVATIFAAFIIGFVEYWALALILSSSLIAILFIGGLLAAPLKTWTGKTGDSAAEASVIAEETFASVKTVLALDMRYRMLERYRTPVQLSESFSWRAKSMIGMLLASVMWILNLMYGLAFWQGGRFMRSNTGSLDVGSILITLLAIMTGSMSVAVLAPNIQAFVTGSTAAASVFRIIDRVSPIDARSTEGVSASEIRGEISFNGTRLVYPSRPDVSALRGFDLHIPAGKTTALVGPSGSGKTSVVGLIERFYNAVEGTVAIDGVPIEKYNLASLRSQISLVSQEPILFRQSIRDNIAYGLPQDQMDSLAKEEIDDMVRHAATRAHALDFISALPQGFESVYGNQGISLSGGQRQRVAIARAIISDPKILLLDEATSALDTESEREVQAALTEMAKDRTTVMIAHRLSTIRAADSIAVVEGGRVCEQGTHSELLQRKGVYKTLVDAQTVAGNQAIAPKYLEDRDMSMAELSKQDTQHSDKIFEATRQSSGLKPTVTIDSKKGLDERPNDDLVPKYSLWQIIKFVYIFNAPERGLLLVGSLLSIISGLVQPVTAVLFAKSIFALAVPPGYGRGINFWCAMYLMVAFVALIALGGRGVAFAKCSARSTRRIRLHLFAFFLSQEASWFDQPENSPGMLTALLSTEPENMAGVSGATLGTLIDGAVTLFGGCILALAIGWKLALVCISVVPVILVSGFTNVSLLGKFQKKASKTFENSASSACELIAGVRTVASLSREDYVWGIYHKQLYDAERSSMNWVLVSSLSFAFSQATPYLIFALVFWYGGGLVASGEYGPQQFFIALMAVIFGAQSAAQFFGFAPDMSKARLAAGRVMSTLGSIKHVTDDVPMTNPSTFSENEELKENQASAGQISLRNVGFRYAGLTGAQVLDNVSLHVNSGAFIALVGPSGSGKSTIISLITRNYLPNSGVLSVNGADISKTNPSELRKKMSLVSQEPILFSDTIRENILMGLPADAPPMKEEDLVQCCIDANIHDFVTSLPDGYNTLIGTKGVTLSGGQRQRVTIARALLRNPKILLLDEATSALDSESEGIVQAALNRAAEGRTTVAVAHRLSTIRNADCIFVLDKGRVVEKGTHSELMVAKGLYQKFVEEQDLTMERAVK